MEYKTLDQMPKDGKYHDVVCILIKDNLSRSIFYRVGCMSDNLFSIGERCYWRDRGFRDSKRQDKIIGFAYLEKPNIEFIRKILRENIKK